MAALKVFASSRAVITTDDDTLLLTPATIVVSPSTGKIQDIYTELRPATDFPGADYTDYSPQLLLPGLVDAHVHLNDPGRAEWEGFFTGTRAAASGGVTTVVDMPLNSLPPTTTVAGLHRKLEASQGQLWVDVGFYGGVIPGNADQLLPLVEAGVRGFKAFMIESGVDEFPAVSSSDIQLAMNTLKDAKTTLMFHAEMIPPISDSVGDAVLHADPPLAPHGPLDSYNTFLESRPPSFETYAVAEVISLAAQTPQIPVHIVHVSAIQVLPLLRNARAAGINITAETCFHYLGLASESIEDGDTRHKCCPPIREQSNRDGLWEELARGEDSCLRTIVSDHSPCTPELKLLPDHLDVCAPTVRHSDSGVDVRGPLDRLEELTATKTPQSRGDFFAAWGGISSVGLGLPILMTDIKQRKSPLTIVDVVRYCAQATAKQVGLSHVKGALRKGMDADICIVDDEETWSMNIGDMKWKNKCSPWEGKEFTARVKETWLRGSKIYVHGGKNSGFEEGSPTGRPLLERRTA
ncbi:Allantoinase [Ceratocystis platani]|uniref:Allantoinase n=1 Tax=Ceratocystis fimbriata f. sp. platani TaxID=88771 RepID=A0A0F8BST9_CERFI|nr:Allantoinase [Ceratocystis platani]